MSQMLFLFLTESHLPKSLQKTIKSIGMFSRITSSTSILGRGLVIRLDYRIKSV